MGMYGHAVLAPPLARSRRRETNRISIRGIVHVLDFVLYSDAFAHASHEEMSGYGNTMLSVLKRYAIERVSLRAFTHLLA